MRRKTAVAALICGFLLLITFWTARGQGRLKAIKTSICEISANPTRFTGKTVEFSAQFESDGIERSVLTDQNCKDTGIAPSSANHFKGEADLEKELNVGHPGTIDKTINGIFVGRFLWRPQNIPRRILILTAVRDLTSTIK